MVSYTVSIYSKIISCNCICILSLFYIIFNISYINILLSIMSIRIWPQPPPVLYYVQKTRIQKSNGSPETKIATESVCSRVGSCSNKTDSCFMGICFFPAANLRNRSSSNTSSMVLSYRSSSFVTNGSCTEGTIYGDQNHAPNGDAEVRTSGCWSLWKNIAKQDPAFGHPEKFCSDITKTKMAGTKLSVHL